MLWGGEETLDAYVSTEGVRLWRAGRPVFCAPGAPWATGLDRALEAAGLPRRRWPFRNGVRVWLSGALARPFLMPIAAGLRSNAELAAVAAARASQESGAGGDHQVWLDARPGQGQALAVAVRKDLMRELHTGAGRVAARVVSLRPWWTLALEADPDGLGDVDAVAVEDTDALVFLASGSESWHEAVIYEPRPTGLQAEATVQRLGLGLPSGSARVRRARLPALDAPRASLAPVFVRSLADG